MKDARERGAKSRGDRYLSYLMFLGAIMIMPMAAEQYPPPAWPPVLVLTFASLVTGFTLHPRIAGSRVGSVLRIVAMMAWATWFLMTLLHWLEDVPSGRPVGSRLASASTRFHHLSR